MDYDGEAWMSVMFSPLSNIRPIAFLTLDFVWYSYASSSTKFIYSSKPIRIPSILNLTLSESQICILERFCKYLKMRLIGWTITFWTFGLEAV